MFRTAFHAALPPACRLLLMVAIASTYAAARVPAARADEPPGIAPPDSVVKRGEWSLVVYGGTVSGFDYETNLEQTGFGDDIPGGCTDTYFGRFCHSGSRYPRELLEEEMGSRAIQFWVRMPSRWQASLLGSSTPLRGWRGHSSEDGSLVIQARSRSISALAGWGKPVRIAIGPALVERTIVFNFNESDSDVALGAVGEVGIQLRTRRFLVFGVAARYQWAGSRSATHTVGSQNYEVSGLSFSHASFMIGVGFGGAL